MSGHSRCHWLGLLAALVLTGCQSMGVSELFGDAEPAVDANTLASLQPATLERSDAGAASSSERVSLKDVIESYESLLPLLDDPEDVVRAQHRLADLRFLQAENRMVDEAVVDVDVAIQAYERLLETYPNRATNDQIYYQLAKAHELNGNTGAYLQTLDQLADRYPNSELWVEAQFRRGEVLFSNYDYAAAEQAFSAVIQADDGTPGKQTFVTNAHYMKGWSQFKQGNYDGALLSYINVLDLVLPADQQIESVGDTYRTMTEDLFRVMGLSFSYLGGADSVAALFEQTGSRPYEILVYDRYSDLLLEKEQYTDAIAVYERYIAIHPLSQWAPRYHINIINTLQQAGFTADIPERKAGFVSSYGITSRYWAQAVADGEAGRLDFVKVQLEQLLPELANRHYVKAQRAKQQSEQQKKQQQEAEGEYRQAAHYYAEFVDTFPSHERAPELLFLLAETRLELNQWAPAIRAFERVAYDYPGNDRAAEAAYASILAYRTYVDTWPTAQEDDYRALLELQQQSRLRFVRAFPEDERAVDVLYVATQYDYEQHGYLQVVQRAQQIIDWQPPPTLDMLLEARLLKAHSFYALEDYPQAELAYQDALIALFPEDKRYPGVVENLAASVYRQAEARLAAGDQLAAVNEFLRVGQVAPTSTLRANAEYDAANTLIELANWRRAIDVMTAFRASYPQHEMIDTLPAKMALAYRETAQWELAADELQTLFELADTEEEKRETLLIAAELYDRADNADKAISSYRQYANAYPAPLDAYMEASNRLAELYQRIDEPVKRRFWLARQMEAVDQNPDHADDRMRYLAAEASAVLANDALVQYNGIELTLPLEQTMAAKIQALEQAVNAYQKTASYGVSTFSTEAGYRIADIYARLGSDLMAAERPGNLSELEQMQYDLLLEEQAFPFEENAIDIHEQNASRSWNGIYDEWVKQSFDALKKLMPARYDKPELVTEVVNDLE